MGFIGCRNPCGSLFFMVAVMAFYFVGSAGLAISSNNPVPGPTRKLLQTENTTEPSSQSDGTARRDPLDKLKKYRGGFDIRNKHYWSSVIFTGIGGYAVGALCLLCGVAYGGLLLVSSCRKNRKGVKLKKKQCALWLIFLATCFTIMAITLSGVVLGGSAKFHSRARTMMNIIIDTADDASETIRNMTQSMVDVRDNLQRFNPGMEASNFFKTSSQELESEAANIQRQAKKNRNRIETGLKIVHIVTTVTISLNLAALVLLPVVGFMRFRGLIWLIVLLWLLTTFCWLFFGAYFFLERFAGDACTALDNFKENPFNNTLSSILPCKDVLSAKPVLSTVSAGIYNLVNEVNANISGLQTASSQNIVQICNPFSGPPEYKYLNESCPENTIKMRDIPRVLKMLNCSNSNGGCEKGRFISHEDLTKVENLISSLENLVNEYPAMESLVECQLVKEAFSTVVSNHCKPARRYVRMVWIPMVCLSVVMVILVLIWAVKAHQRNRWYFSEGSVKPVIEVETCRDGQRINHTEISPLHSLRASGLDRIESCKQ